MSNSNLNDLMQPDGLLRSTEDPPSQIIIKTSHGEVRFDTPNTPDNLIDTMRSAIKIIESEYPNPVSFFNLFALLESESN